MAVCSLGGNITTTISNHFSQCSALNIQPAKIKNQDRYGRSYKNFDHDVIDKELLKIDWDILFREKKLVMKNNYFPKKNTNCLLDKIAPFK